MALELRWSVHNAVAGNANVGTAALSLGAYCSQTVILDATDNNLFDDVDAGESTSGHTDYRIVFLVNNTSAAETDVTVYLTGASLGDSTITVGLDPAGLTPIAQAGTWQSAIIGSGAPPPTGDEAGTPLLVGGGAAGYVWSSPTVAAPLTIPQIPAGYVQGIGLKRVVDASAAPLIAATISLVGVSTESV